MNSDKEMKYACELIIVNLAAYEAMCNAYGVTRAYGLPDNAVYSEWEKHCVLTKERAKCIIADISAYNFNNVSRQISAMYRVRGDEVVLTINGEDFVREDYTRVVTMLRNAGIRTAYAKGE